MFVKKEQFEKRNYRQIQMEYWVACISIQHLEIDETIVEFRARTHNYISLFGVCVIINSCSNPEAGLANLCRWKLLQGELTGLSFFYQ